jgi:cobyrinic acid a,c-diamide synthase
MAALVARGLRVQPFKTGPDFIDPSHHTEICGRVSRNLDPFMMGVQGVTDTFCRASTGADIAVIEGVMGLYDGIEETEYASTAHVAKILKAPVLLVIDAKGMSRSAHALIRGYRTFDPRLDINGIVVNKIGSQRHRTIVEQSGKAPFVGWLPKKDELVVRSRHLGLAMAGEGAGMKEFGSIVEEHCDIDAILRIADTAPELCSKTAPSFKNAGVRVRIGIASDPAFCFYYADNLDRLRAAGAELVFFSPMSDKLPVVDGIYLGGGYPELHLPALSESACRNEIRKAVESNMPVYGECGGLIYLTREITSGRTYPLSGVLPAVSAMTIKVQALGYVAGSGTGKGSFFPAGTRIRGHEFHYSQILPDRDAQFAIRLSRGKGIDAGNDGLLQNNAIGAYTHSYFSTTFARLFVSLCSRYAASH